MFLFLLVMVVLALLCEYASLRRTPDCIRCRVFPAKRLAEPGDSFTVQTELCNVSRRFVPFVRVREFAPQAMYNEDKVPREQDCASYFLRPRERLVRSREVSLPARGRYIFRGGTLHIGDFLGFTERAGSFDQIEEIVVMPAPYGRLKTEQLLGGFWGDISVRRFILEDPILSIGAREYTGLEPMRQISWTRSAALGHLMVKNYDYTVDSMVTVLLDVDLPRGSRRLTERTEQAFSLTRSLCELLEEKRIRYRLLTDAGIAGAEGIRSGTEDGLGEEHLRSMLELLGRATLFCRYHLDTLLEKASQLAETGRSHILVTVSREDLSGKLRHLEDLTGGVCALIRVPDEKEAP